MSDLTQERIRELLFYEEETGKFFYKIPKGRMLAGDPAGASRKNGYVIIIIDGKSRQAHRLAWLYVYGKWPDGVIDHINGNPGDNRIVNLRDVSQSENQQNRHSIDPRNRVGCMGVTWDSEKQRWRSRIILKGKYISLGRHKTAEEAIAARKAAELIYYPTKPERAK